jgi:hypothetical protein
MVSKSRKNNRARRSVKKGGAGAEVVFAGPAPMSQIQLKNSVRDIQVVQGNNHSLGNIAKSELRCKLMRAIMQTPTLGPGVERGIRFYLQILTFIERQLTVFEEQEQTVNNATIFVQTLLDNLDVHLDNPEGLTDVLLGALPEALNGVLPVDPSIGVNYDNTASTRFQNIVTRINNLHDAFDQEPNDNDPLSVTNGMCTISGGTRKRRKSKKGGKRRKSHKR